MGGSTAIPPTFPPPVFFLIDVRKGNLQCLSNAAEYEHQANELFGPIGARVALSGKQLNLYTLLKMSLIN